MGQTGSRRWCLGFCHSPWQGTSPQESAKSISSSAWGRGGALALVGQGGSSKVHWRLHSCVGLPESFLSLPRKAESLGGCKGA